MSEAGIEWNSNAPMAEEFRAYIRDLQGRPVQEAIVFLIWVTEKLLDERDATRPGEQG